jgi:hypothetical protein
LSCSHLQTNSKPKTQVQPKLGRRYLFFFLRAHQTTEVSLKKNKIKQRKCSFTRYCKKCSFTIPREKSVPLQSQAESDSTEVILKLVLGKMLGGTIQQPLMPTVLTWHRTGPEIFGPGANLKSRILYYNLYFRTCIYKILPIKIKILPNSIIHKIIMLIHLTLYLSPYIPRCKLIDDVININLVQSFLLMHVMGYEKCLEFSSRGKLSYFL